MLLQIGIGDAFGIAWEFVKDPEAHGLVNDGVTYQQNPRYAELLPSQYTDDTLRSIATTAVLLSSSYQNCAFANPINYAGAIQSVYKTDKRKGWSKRFQTYLEDTENYPPSSFIYGIDKKAETNGAIMGCLPIGYLATPSAIRLAAGAQAVVTHSSATIPYAQMMALSAHHFLTGGLKSNLIDFLIEEVEGDAMREIKDRGFDAFSSKSMLASDTAHAALSLILRHNSMAALLQDAVAAGHDTDSVAALSLGLASCSNEYVDDLSPSLIEGLDDGKGAKKLTDLDLMLRQWAP